MADTYKYLGESGLEELINQTKTYDAASLAVAKKYADDQIAANKITVDTALSDTSTNSIQNKVVKAEFDEVRSEIDAIESSLTSGTIIVKEAEHAESADTATSATSATSATKAAQDASGNVITETYETKTDASAKLVEAKSYADSAVTTVKNDLLNGAGEAYDTLKELGELIDTNVDAIDALKTVATNKADKEHTHTISEITDMPEVANADWNENDPESAAYIQNRTHYEFRSQETLVDNVSFTVEADYSDDSGTYGVLDDPFTVSINSNSEYIVYWDDAEYYCTPFKTNIGGGQHADAIGSKTYGRGDGDPDEAPFEIYKDWWSSDYTKLYSGDIGSHTITIIEVTSTVEKIDEKYLPDTVALKSDFESLVVAITNDEIDAICGTSIAVANLISFMIDGTEYQAEDGMTWEEWVNSDYALGHTATFDIVGSGVSVNEGNVSTSIFGVEASDLIIDGEEYSKSAGSIEDGW